MTIQKASRGTPLAGLAVSLLKVVAVSAALFSVTACRTFEENNKITGWTIVDPEQRHPIMVSQQPSKLVLKVARNSYGLSPEQRAKLYNFATEYRANYSSNSKLVIHAPSGGPNEVAAMQAVAEIRHLLREAGFDESLVTIEAYSDESDPQPPVRVSFLRYVAEGPECGNWPTNLARQTDGLNYANFGCTQQKNLAAMVANPADLLGPRGSTSRDGSRRDIVWEKYRKGESTGAQKSQDEKVRVKGAD